MPRLLPAVSFLWLVGSFVAPADVIAETKIITAAASYTMGDGETPLIAEARVLQQAKQMALEQAGIYVESYTKVQNYDLTAQEIQTIAGGIIAVEVLEKTRKLVGDGIRFDVKIKATVTTDKMEALVQRIKGKNVAEEYEALQREYARLNEEIETWKRLVAKAPAGPERNAALEQIRERETAFSEVQHKETTLFKRLVSGESLFSKALSQLSKKKDEKAIVDALFRKILKQGHIITIGEPDIKATLRDEDKVEISVPVTLQATEAIKAVMEKTARDLRGRVGGINYDDIYGAQALAVRISRDSETIEHFQRRIGSLVFILELVLNDGKALGCYVEDYKFKPIFPISFYYRDTVAISMGISPFYDGTGGRVGIFDAAVTFIVKIAVPLGHAKRIATIRGKMGEGLGPSYARVEGMHECSADLRE